MRSVTRRPRGRPDGTTVSSLLEALERMLEQGRSFTTVSVDELAREAGISRATFYLHFRNKGDVVRRLMEEVEKEVAAAAGVSRSVAMKRCPVTAFSVLLAGMIMLLAAFDAGRQTRLRAEARERQEEARARFLAFHDPVTRLPNRTHFKQEIVNFIGRAARSGKSFDLYYCVFQLTGLRDAQAIDEAALTISSRLRELARPGDMLVRHDRAEFLLVRSRSDAGDLPPRVRGLLLEACRGAVHVNGSYLIPEVHVGCAEYPKDGTNSRNLLLAASRAPGAPRAAMPIPSTETDAREVEVAELRHRVA